jgi:hypothetical protein
MLDVGSSVSKVKGYWAGRLRFDSRHTEALAASQYVESDPFPY